MQEFRANIPGVPGKKFTGQITVARVHDQFTTWDIESIYYDHSDQHVDFYIDFITPHLRKNLVIPITWEAEEPEEWLFCLTDILQRVKALSPSTNITVIMGTWFEKFSWDIIKSLVKELIFIDFFLLKTYHLLEVKKISAIVPQWNPDSDQYLVLIGKPHKVHRTRLLWFLYKNKLLDRCEWSFHIPPRLWRRCRELVPELNDVEFADFVQQQTRFPDGVERLVHYTGIPYQLDLYANKLFAVISESDFDRALNGPWTSEKTWIYIANRLPFIFAAKQGMCDMMQQRGFYVFRDFMEIQNYDNPEQALYLERYVNRIDQIMHRDGFGDFYNIIRDHDWPGVDELLHSGTIPVEIAKEILSCYREPIKLDSDHRLDAICVNVRHWLDNIVAHKETIAQQVEHNRMLYLTLGAEQYQHMQDFIARHNLECEIFDVLFLEKNMRNNPFYE
jgi:hypothetical protein